VTTKKSLLSVISSNCAAVVNICGGNCWFGGGGMPGPNRGICAPPGAPGGGTSSSVRFSILRNG
jgi:hypothetical protein